MRDHSSPWVNTCLSSTGAACCMSCCQCQAVSCSVCSCICDKQCCPCVRATLTLAPPQELLPHL